MKAALYARVSSKAQKDRHTIENQLRTLPEFARSRGWTVVGRPYIDDGRTAMAGHLERRDGLTELLRDAKARRFDVVVVVDLDRLTRSEDLSERYEVLGAFQRAGVKIACAGTGQLLDLSSSEGDLFASVQSFFAADWVRKHRERIMSGKLRAIAEGKKPAGPTPFGYVYSRESGWRLHEQHAQAVREIFLRVAAGESCQAIADSLADRGFERPRGGAWSMERTWQIATSSTYMGEWTADKARGLRVPVPPIVSEVEWYAAQHALERHRKRGLRRTKHVYLLEGLGVCGLCEAAIHLSSHGAGATGPHARAATYVCSRRRRPPRGQAPCTLPHHKVVDVDGLIWEEMSQFALRPDILGAAAKERIGDAEHYGEAWRSDLVKARARLEQVRGAEAAMLARFRKGLISESAMDRELAVIAREVAMLQHQVAAAETAAGAATSERVQMRRVDDLVKVLRRKVRSANMEQKRELVALLLGGTNVIFTPTEIRASVRLSSGVASHPDWTVENEANTSDLLEFPLVLRVA